jgi:hypothetical protein
MMWPETTQLPGENNGGACRNIGRDIGRDKIGYGHMQNTRGYGGRNNVEHAILRNTSKKLG